MDSSRLTEIRRNQAMLAYAQLNPTTANFPSERDVVQKGMGAMSEVFQGRVVGAPPTMSSTSNIVTETQTEEELIQTAILNATANLFTYMAQVNSGPTICTRLMYLFFFSLTASYNGVVGGRTGIHDGWNWSTVYPRSTDTLYSWIQQTLAFCVPNIIPGWGNGVTTFTPAFTVFSTAWTTWFSGRATDGNTAARTPPSYTLLNNNGTEATYLETTTSQDFTNTTYYQNPAKWTPLSINGAKKNYLTYGWGSVRSPSLSAADETSILAVANPLNASGAARTAEIASLLSLSESLTDEQKVIAEFWAGGANTVTPPGMCLWLWKEYIISQKISDLNILFFSGLDLCVAIFEASRLCWNSKGTNLQARPIQEIRRTSGPAVRKYDGTTIARNVWVPYQPPNSVTPPFPDFPSGHSTFSQTFANVMTDWFGPTITPARAPFTGIHLLSPMIKTSQAGNNFGTFTISVGSSDIQPGVVPSIPITLSFSTWQAMADQAGVSRQYGGIHAASADIGGKALANALRPVQKNNWRLLP